MRKPALLLLAILLVSGTASVLYLSAGGDVKYSKLDDTHSIGFTENTSAQANNLLYSKISEVKAGTITEFSTVISITALDCTPEVRDRGVKLDGVDKFYKGTYFVTISKDATGNTTVHAEALGSPNTTASPARCWNANQTALQGAAREYQYATPYDGGSGPSCGDKTTGCGWGLSTSPACNGNTAGVSCPDNSYTCDTSNSAGGCGCMAKLVGIPDCDLGAHAACGGTNCCTQKSDTKGSCSKLVCPSSSPVYDSVNDKCCPTGQTYHTETQTCY